MSETNGIASAWGGDGPPVDDVVIDAAEDAIGARFPVELRTFYLAHNGGWPQDDQSTDSHPFVHGYTPIGEPSDDTCLVGLAALLAEQSTRLAGLIPFGYDAGGNIFLSPSRDAASPMPLIWLPQTDELEPCEEYTLADLLPPPQAAPLDHRMSAIASLRSSGWLYAPATEQTPLARGPLERVDNSVRSWAASFSSLSSADETTWFLATDDYAQTRTEDVAWNEFESISLEAASSGEERAAIIDFWSAHVPILLSVRGHYSYLAARRDHAIVYGEEPEFEQTEVIASDFPALLDMIVSRRGHGLLDSLLLS